MNIIEGYINHMGNMITSVINLEQEQYNKRKEKEYENL